VSAHMSQQWAIEANRHKQDVPTLSACYQWHMWLFSEMPPNVFHCSGPRTWRSG
jgi:hypothetical protein